MFLDHLKEIAIQHIPCAHVSPLQPLVQHLLSGKRLALISTVRAQV